jgi:hypothetical protein
LLNESALEEKRKREIDEEEEKKKKKKKKKTRSSVSLSDTIVTLFYPLFVEEF